ncbi:peptidoglycan-binding domain-containing protein [Leifsonia sp. 21MFCrub1.1]|uniref:peptidoglycan-binding domain-containing protein n=1 Tax=Leifsonia sp. 21MFCrub1.1 TaxID=1798223 RepID=UPI000AE213A2|nr:peptidoglycan-binding domain-containing protein [Leifsonia sp. 21MFCrub1.1]
MGNDKFDDSRPIQLSVKAATPSHLFAPAGGRVTAFECEQGAAMTSGDTPLSIDGNPKLALATAVPLWRDLALRAQGDDVKAVQQELIRLGHPVGADGRLGAQTLAALKSVLTRVGVTVEGDVVPVSSFVWLPEASATISTCDVSVGAEIASAASLATFASASPKVTVVALPTDLVSGPRVVQIGSSRYPLRDDGEVTVPDVTSLGGQAASEDSSTAGKPIDAQILLATPIDVRVVPPSSVYDIAGSSGCVASGRATYRVRLVGSQLGQSLVDFGDTHGPHHVDVPPRNRKPCA